jgi:uncharacterized protein YkwD
MGPHGKRNGAAVLFVLAFACPLWMASAAGRDRAASAPASAHSAASVEASIRGCANRQRESRGLHALQHDSTLDRAAELHARRMLAKGFFDHQDPAGDGPADRVKRYAKRRYVIIGENIAAGYESVGAACREWMDSPEHRENILRSRFTRIGAGYASGSRHYGRYYVQVFADA